jgi:hypothetical protein
MVTYNAYLGAGWSRVEILLILELEMFISMRANRIIYNVLSTKSRRLDSQNIHLLLWAFREGASSDIALSE